MSNRLKNKGLDEQAGPLAHGGQLNQLAHQYTIPKDKWLDLSTGIAPLSFPVPTIPTNVWQQLPQSSETLLKSASEYYQTPNLLATSGSQAVIQVLPKVVAMQGYANSRVWLPKVGYKEHQKAWRSASYHLKPYNSLADIKLASKDILVLINPNNPSGKTYHYQEVAQLFNRVKQQDGLMIIDEAFMDCTPEHSFIKHSDNPQLIVLRSVGKFFGLAGIRLGFVAAATTWLTPLTHQLGPWSVSGPAQFIGQHALADKLWQAKQRDYLKNQSQDLALLLKTTFKQTPTGTYLFQTVKLAQAPLIFDNLCKQGVYVRLCDERDALRFGIPTPVNMERLKETLNMLFS